MYALLNTYTVLNMAQQLALSRLPGVTDVTDAAVGKTVRNLVLTEDFFLIQKLQRYAREAVDGSPTRISRCSSRTSGSPTTRPR